MGRRRRAGRPQPSHAASARAQVVGNSIRGVELLTANELFPRILDVDPALLLPYEVAIVSATKQPFSIFDAAGFDIPKESGSDPHFDEWERREGPYATNGSLAAYIKRSSVAGQEPDLFTRTTGRAASRCARRTRRTRHGSTFATSVRAPTPPAAALDLLDRRHPREPHWYLFVVGSDPARRGRGLGHAVIAPVLDRCDEDGLPAYLESSNPANVPYYARMGFEVTGELTRAGCPPLIPMRRQPR